jgi:hypothetical protein
MISKDDLDQLKINPGTTIFVQDFDSLKCDIEKAMNKISVNILEYTGESQVVIFYDSISEMTYEFNIIEFNFGFQPLIKRKMISKINSLKENCRERILSTLN